MTEPSVDERTPSAAHDHPPFRLRERRLVLLPDLRPPTLEELRWAARERRRRREPPQQRVSVEHEPEAGREPVDVPATITESVPTDVEPSPTAPAEVDTTESELAESEPVEADLAEVEPAVIDLVALEEAAAVEPEPPQLRPWRPPVLPGPEAEAAPEPAWVAEVRAEVAPVVVEPESPSEAEPEPEAPADLAPELPADLAPPRAPVEPADESAPPLVSQVLVVREPAPGGIAVLEDLEAQARTVTRLVPLPAEVPAAAPFDDPLEELVDDDVAEQVVSEAVEEEEEEQGRSAPLYWRLLRLRHTRPNGWLRALYFEGSVAVGVVLVLAEAASVWTIVVLPLVVAVVVKANDVLAGNLGRAYRQPQRRSGG